MSRIIHRNGTVEDDFAPIDGRAKSGAAFIVHNPETGDYAKAWWAVDMWALYCGPDFETVMQLDFEPTHYRSLMASNA